MASHRSEAQPSGNIPVVFKAVERLVSQKLARTPGQFHVCVKIDAPMLRHDQKPDKIT